MQNANDSSVTGQGAAAEPATAPKIPLPPKPAEAETEKKKAATPAAPAVAKPKAGLSMMPHNDVLQRIIDKIRTSENILVALSRNPSVDELAAAIGLTIFLDGLQKHTTAIYSGETPDALQFLQPDTTFETNTDSLQDFIISLNKEKADHLRYKLDGDFVKVYITPYKSRITEDDLEFAHGDYNVELVLAIGVPSANDLDTALTEYGRIMHDATTVDITCTEAGRFAELEWDNPEASSVSEMITKLIFTMEGQDANLDKDVATALLTGIVAATGRFSNDRTNSDTLQLASKLMAMGADQQLISAHVMDNDMAKLAGETANEKKDESGELSIKEAEAAEKEKEIPDIPTVVQPDVPKAEEAIPAMQTPMAPSAVEAAAKAAVNNAVMNAAANAAAAGATGVGMENGHLKDYAQMMEEALAEPAPSVAAGQPMAGGVGMAPPVMAPGPVPTEMTAPAGTAAMAGAVMNMAAPAAPEVRTHQILTNEPMAAPVNGTPVENAGAVLPPPPAPTTGAEFMPPVLPPVQIPPEMQANAAMPQPVVQPAQPAPVTGAPAEANASMNGVPNGELAPNPNLVTNAQPVEQPQAMNVVPTVEQAGTAVAPAPGQASVQSNAFQIPGM